MRPIPYVDFRAQFQVEKAELMPLIEGVFERGVFIGGESVEALETELATFCGVRHAIALNSGTDALMDLGRAVSYAQHIRKPDDGRVMRVLDIGPIADLRAGTHPTKGSYFTRGTSRDRYARQLDEARATLAEAQADAERYRWLRSKAKAMNLRMDNQHDGYHFGAHLHRLKGPTFDAAIDAARAEGKGAGE